MQLNQTAMLAHRFYVRQMYSFSDQQRSCFSGEELLTKVRNVAQHILAADYEDCSAIFCKNLTLAFFTFRENQVFVINYFFNVTK